MRRGWVEQLGDRGRGGVLIGYLGGEGGGFEEEGPFSLFSHRSELVLVLLFFVFFVFAFCHFPFAFFLLLLLLFIFIYFFYYFFPFLKESCR